MKTNEKYQNKPITRREGEPMIEFLRRKFPERNIQYGVPNDISDIDFERIANKSSKLFLQSFDDEIKI